MEFLSLFKFNPKKRVLVLIYGTFVNGLQVHAKQTLKENDRILIGTSIMKLIKKGNPQPGKPA